MPRDTSDEARAVQLDIRRRMSTQDRHDLAAAMSRQTRRIRGEGIQARHPEYSASDVEWALRRLELGDELFRGAWPDAPLLAP